MRKPSLPLALGWLLAGVAPTLLHGQLSLGTVVALAERNSSAVKLAEANVQKAEAVLEETRDVYIPSLEAGSSIGMRSIGFPAGQPSILNLTMESQVLSFAQWQYIRAARTGIQAAVVQLKDAREQVSLDASVAYLELDCVHRELDAVDQQEVFAAHLVEMEQQRAEAGIDPTNDLLQARLTAAELKLKRIHLDARTQTLTEQLAVLTALPAASITTDPSSIPLVPEIQAHSAALKIAGMQDAADLSARAKRMQARGDSLSRYFPIVSFAAQYNRDSTVFADYLHYYENNPPANNLSAGFSVQFPIFDLSRRAKAKESTADALRATVEAEGEHRQYEVQIATLTGTLRELGTMAEIADLKQEIANQQLKSVLTQLESGNGASGGTNPQPQLSPKAEQLARIDERQKFQDSLDAALELSKTRLNLLRALGHMEDWLHELHP